MVRGKSERVFGGSKISCSPNPCVVPIQDRPDLVEKAIAGTDLEFFRRAGFEF
jgi:hypothetical protein